MWYVPLSIVFFFTSVFQHETVHCTYNIYIDKRDVYPLLGIKAEVYYVRNGTINHNALNHVFTLPTDLNVDYFTWESFDVPIPYYRDINISDEKVIRYMSMNVSNSGIIPVVRETVATEIICSGLLDAEVEIEFNFNLTIDSSLSNFTQISFKRKKLCHRDLLKSTNDIDLQPIPVENFDSSQLTVFYVVLCLGCSLFTLLIVCFLAFIASNKKDSRHGDTLQDEQQIRLRSTMAQNAPYVLSTLGVNSGTSTSSNMSHASNKRNINYIQLDNRSLDLPDKITEIAVERKRIRLQKIELEGTFGRVFNGTYTKEDGSEEGVLVKTVMDFACPTQVQLLLKEGLSMCDLKHRNIMAVMGVSMEEHAEPFIIYLREGYSNLKKFLQKCKLSSEGIAHTLTTQEVVEMTLQIIAGIQYMHKKKFLHKDLAARNCLVDGGLNVKIADSALSRDLFPNDYHCLGDNENRPVKWLAIESLVCKTFSTASDVWSFGVTLWELTTLAQQPYVEVDPFEIEHYLKDGYRLSQPVNCPDELFAVMAYCWAMSPDERPTFSQLLTCLQDFRNQLNKFV